MGGGEHPPFPALAIIGCIYLVHTAQLCNYRYVCNSSPPYIPHAKASVPEAILKCHIPLQALSRSERVAEVWWKSHN